MHYDYVQKQNVNATSATTTNASQHKSKCQNYKKNRIKHVPLIAGGEERGERAQHHTMTPLVFRQMHIKTAAMNAVICMLRDFAS